MPGKIRNQQVTRSSRVAGSKIPQRNTLLSRRIKGANAFDTLSDTKEKLRAAPVRLCEGDAPMAEFFFLISSSLFGLACGRITRITLPVTRWIHASPKAERP